MNEARRGNSDGEGTFALSADHAASPALGPPSGRPHLTANPRAHRTAWGTRIPQLGIEPGGTVVKVLKVVKVVKS